MIIFYSITTVHSVFNLSLCLHEFCIDDAWALDILSGRKSVAGSKVDATPAKIILIPFHLLSCNCGLVASHDHVDFQILEAYFRDVTSGGELFTRSQANVTPPVNSCK